MYCVSVISIGRRRSMRKISRKSLLNALVLIIIFILTILSVFRGEDLGKVADCLQMATDTGCFPPSHALYCSSSAKQP